MTTPAERKGLTQGKFREANEKLEHGAQELIGADYASFVPFLCECPRPSCVQVVLLTLAEYEDVRSHPAFGLAVPGHEDQSIERVVTHNERFLTTETFGTAGQVHDDTDPRHA